MFFAEHKSLIWMSLNLTFFYPKVFIQGFILKDFLYSVSQRFFFFTLKFFLFMFRSLISLRFISVVVLVKIQFYFSPYKEPPFPIWPAKPSVCQLPIDVWCHIYCSIRHSVYLWDSFSPFHRISLVYIFVLEHTPCFFIVIVL